ncbi:MAG: serine protease [Sedimentisphaerales bacterium]|nr:serine protease [Sedimentisphaerales bacterium]
MINNNKIRNTNLIFFLLAGILLSGCEPERKGVKAEPKISINDRFPINRRAEIILPLEYLDKRIVLKDGQNNLTLNDTLAVNKTAKEAFFRLFKKIGTRGKIAQPHFSVKIKPNLEIDTENAAYYANVLCVLSYGDGTEIGIYEGAGSDRTLSLEQEGLENAYRNAFTDVIKQIKNDSDTIKAITSDESNTRTRPVYREAEQLPPEYQKLVEAIVTIEVYKDKKLPMHLKANGIRKAHGTGFFINNEGLIITNGHVIKNADKILVLYNHDEHLPDIIALDEWNDLALLDIRIKETPSLKFAEEKDYEVGGEVSAIGSPILKDLKHTVSKGIISSIREIEGYRLIQTDAAINPGNSGGPLVKTDNLRVIGMVTLTVRGEGLGFAVPVETINAFLKAHNVKY